MDGKQEIKYYKRYADDILIILDNLDNLLEFKQKEEEN